MAPTSSCIFLSSSAEPLLCPRRRRETVDSCSARGRGPWRKSFEMEICCWDAILNVEHQLDQLHLQLFENLNLHFYIWIGIYIFVNISSPEKYLCLQTQRGSATCLPTKWPRWSSTSASWSPVRQRAWQRWRPRSWRWRRCRRPHSCARRRPTSLSQRPFCWPVEE